MPKNILSIGFEEDQRFGDIDPVYVNMDRLIPANHSCLLQFIEYDLSKAEKPLIEYLSCIDSGKEPRKHLLLTAMSELQQMHPYFLICRENAAFLLNCIFAGYIMRHCSDMDELEQKNLFMKVCVSDYSLFTDPDNIFDNKIDSGEDHVLDYLYNLQYDIRLWVMLTLDDTNPELARLDRQRRSVLYSHVAMKNEYNPVFSIEVEFSTSMPKKLKAKSAEWDFNEDLYDQLYKDLNVLMWDPEAKLPKSLTDLIKLTKGNEDCDVITYQIRDFTCLLEYEIHRMVLDGIHVKRCRNCHRYFIPERSNIEYCSRVAPNSNGKLCSEIGRFRVYGKKARESDPAYAMFNRAYRARLEKIRRGTMTREFYDKWRPIAEQKLEEVRQGKMDLDAFDEWLKM